MFELPALGQAAPISVLPRAMEAKLEFLRKLISKKKFEKENESNRLENILENLKRIQALADDFQKQMIHLCTWSAFALFFSGHGGGSQRLQLRRLAASWITAGVNRCI